MTEIRETVTIHVNPREEQEQINIMQKFYWDLLNSHEVNSIDKSSLKRGDFLDEIQRSFNYVKLTFTRKLEKTFLNKINQLEKEYYSLPIPKYPKLWHIRNIRTSVIAVMFTWPVSIPIWIIYAIFIYPINKRAAEKNNQQIFIDRQEILERAIFLKDLPVEENKPMSIEMKPQARST